MSGQMDEELKVRASSVMPAGVYGHVSTAGRSKAIPQFFQRAQGAYVWDYDGNQYIDYMCAYGPNLLGYAHPEIDQAYIDQLKLMDNGPGPSHVMVELAERFVDQVSHADWAMFCKNGTDATSTALLAARAHRKKRKVLFSEGAYHGAAPWCTPGPMGTLPDDRAHFITYQYNDTESLKAAVAEAGGDLAAIFVSPFRHDLGIDQENPTQQFAQTARELCNTNDALLIVDDVRAGLRIARDCSWSLLGVQPDISCWGKAIANGHTISAVLGANSCRASAGSVFVTGSYWYGAAAMAAALKTLQIINTSDYLEHTITMGNRLRSGLDKIAQERGIAICQTGPAQMPLIMFNQDNGDRDLTLGGAFVDGLLDRGIYFHDRHNMFINSAITDADIDRTLEAAQAVLRSLTIKSRPATTIQS